MIFIANEPIEAKDIINEYPLGRIEVETVNKMYDSDVDYKYDSIDVFKFELRLRKELVTASKELSRSGIKFEVFRKSRSNEKYWIRTEQGGFITRNDVKPSDAIKDIFINGPKYKTECATAMVIVYYKALLNIFPEEIFNKLFPEIHLMNWHFLNRLIEEVGFMEDTKDTFPGDRRYFINPDVDPSTSYFRGENVIQLTDGLYYGHGIGIATGEAIISELNDYRKEDATKSAYLLDSVGRPDFKKLANVYYERIN